MFDIAMVLDMSVDYHKDLVVMLDIAGILDMGVDYHEDYSYISCRALSLGFCFGAGDGKIHH